MRYKVIWVSALDTDLTIMVVLSTKKDIHNDSKRHKGDTAPKTLSNVFFGNAFTKKRQIA